MKKKLKPLVVNNGTPYVRLDCVMHPLVALADGVPHTFIAGEKKSFLKLTDALDWLSKEIKIFIEKREVHTITKQESGYMENLKKIFEWLMQWKVQLCRDNVIQGENENMNASMNREPVVIFYKGDNNGSFAISTTARDADEFIRECAREFPHLTAVFEGDLDFTFNEVLPLLVDIWAKLKGYKADSVFEQKRLVAGDPMPEIHMAKVHSMEPFCPPTEEELSVANAR